MKKKKRGELMGVTKHVYLDVLDADFLFVISEEKDFLELAKGIVAADRFPELQKMFDDNPLAPTTRGRTFWFGGGGSIVYLRTDDPHYMLHECVHAAHHLLIDRAMPLTPENDEMYAYLISWLYKKVTCG